MTYKSAKFLNNKIRGANGNGSIYVVSLDNNGLDLIGILNGNGYAWENANHRPQLETTWHMSADEHIRTFYQWNGHAFEKRESQNVKL